MENLFSVLIAILCLLIVVYMPELFFQFKKWNKTRLANYYRIDRRLLGKWVLTFTPMSQSRWNKMRNLDNKIVFSLLWSFGFANPYRSMSKNEILNHLNQDSEEDELMSRHTMNRCILKNANKLGLSDETYKSLTVFPPRYAEAIITTI